jgi:hypothetical protein
MQWVGCGEWIFAMPVAYVLQVYVAGDVKQGFSCHRKKHSVSYIAMNVKYRN